MIRPTYNMNDQTLALLPAKQIDYDTIAIEAHKEKSVQQTPFQIIEEACLNYGSTYEGRRDAVVHHTNFKQRTPIPISIKNQLYFFPTHSPKDMNNIWVSALQILQVTAIPKQKQTKKPQSLIVFKCKKTLVIDISLHRLEKQFTRTLEYAYQMESK